MNEIPFYAHAIRPMDPHLCCAVIPELRTPGWEVFQRKAPGNPEAWTLIAIHIGEMAKMLDVDQSVYRSWCEKEIWQLALPVSNHDFYSERIRCIGLTISPRFPAFAIAYLKIMETDQEEKIDFANNCSVFRTDSGMLFATFGEKLGNGHVATAWRCFDLFKNRLCACIISRESHDSTLSAYSILPGVQPEIYEAMTIKSEHILFQELFTCTLSRAANFNLISLEKQRSSILAQLLVLLEEIHRTGVHRDISLDNILLRFEKNSDPVIAKFCDYEFWTAHGDEKKKTELVVNTDFTSPEYAKAVLEKKSSELWVRPFYDLFSLGIVACKLWNLYDYSLPWSTPSWTPLREALHRISQYTTKHFLKEPPDKTSIYYLIWLMTHFDPNRRPTAGEALLFLSKNNLLD